MEKEWIQNTTTTNYKLTWAWDSAKGPWADRFPSDPMTMDGNASTVWLYAADAVDRNWNGLWVNPLDLLEREIPTLPILDLIANIVWLGIWWWWWWMMQWIGMELFVEKIQLNWFLTMMVMLERKGEWVLLCLWCVLPGSSVFELRTFWSDLLF